MVGDFCDYNFLQRIVTETFDAFSEWNLRFQITPT